MLTPGSSRSGSAARFAYGGAQAAQYSKTASSEKRAHQSRPHVFELDPLRATTALVVVAVHTLSFTLPLNHSSVGAYLQNALIIAAHYSREMFMFVTAFALVYVHYGRPFSAAHLWGRRAVGVLFPYCLWSCVYLLLSRTQHSLGSFFQMLLIDLVTGGASFQLYYILLTLQFYLLFPLLLPFLGALKRHPLRSLGISFGLEVLLLYADYRTLQRGLDAHEPLWQFIARYQNSIVFFYQFYFLLGALAALYLPQIRSFLQHSGRWTLVGFLIALLAVWVHFFRQILACNESLSYATSVLQPVMAFYSPAAIAFCLWLASRWARKVDRQGHPAGYCIWSTLSDASFGIYLVHALFLNWFTLALVPAMPQNWPVAVRVFLTWFVTAGCATLASIIMMRIPLLSRLVGRPHTPQKGR